MTTSFRFLSLWGPLCMAADDGGSPSPMPPLSPPSSPAPPTNRQDDQGGDAFRRQHGDRANDPDYLRAEAASYRIQARDAREAAERAEAARRESDARAATAQAEADARASARIAKIQQRTVDAELRAAATAAGIRDQDLITLIKRDGITVDDDGNVSGVQAAVEELRTRKPDWFGNGAGGGNGGGNPPSVSGNGSPTSPTRPSGSFGAPPPNPNPPQNTVATLKGPEYEQRKRDAMRSLRR